MLGEAEQCRQVPLPRVTLATGGNQPSCSTSPHTPQKTYEDLLWGMAVAYAAGLFSETSLLEEFAYGISDPYLSRLFLPSKLPGFFFFSRTFAFSK